MQGDHPGLLGVMPALAALADIPLSKPPSHPCGGSRTTPTAAATINLLPLANPELKFPTGGAYVGEGMLPVPPNLAQKKIRCWGYAEMGELLPEFWTGSREAEAETKAKTRQGRKITDVFTWLYCYSLYVAVLAPGEPQVIPELMAYLNLILRVSQDYEGLGWMRYDSAFRRQAALPHWQ